MIIALTLITFLLLAGMTLECIWRYGFWSAWAVFCWFLMMGFGWLLLADVASRMFEYTALSQAPLRNGIFRGLAFIGAFQWMWRQADRRVDG